MTALPRITLACLLAASSAAFAAERTGACATDPKATGLPERVETMRSHMNRIEWTEDRDERRRLMDLHMKVMHEGIRELNRREPSDGCRMEMMHAMMEQMMRHQLAAQEADAR